MRRVIRTALLCGAAMGAVAAPASASTTRVVDNDKAQCPKATYATIQSAVDAAQPGDRIAVCPGTYSEQVTVGSGKDHVSLYSTEFRKAIIQAPAAMLPPNAIVEINGAKDVSLTSFTIQGPATVPGSVQFGVLVDGGASAGIFLNRVTHIRDNPLSGNQYGVGILVGRQSTATTGTALISGNQVDDFQKAGIVVDNTGSKGTITLNDVRGIGSTPTIASNGIQVSDGANGDVTFNSVAQNKYALPTFEASGIILYQPGKVRIADNLIHDNDGGVVSYFSDKNTTIEHNATYSNTYDGVELGTVNGTIVRGNAASKNGDSGIGLFYGSMGAQILSNLATDNANDGLFADTDTSGNTLKSNTALRNASYDCEDSSPGTLNTWTGNTGETSNPAGLCTKPSSGGHDGGHHGYALQGRSALKLPKVSLFR